MTPGYYWYQWNGETAWVVVEVKADGWVAYIGDDQETPVDHARRDGTFGAKIERPA